jgi:hypothetical protein
MNLLDAQHYLINLHKNDCLYHLDDDPVDCLSKVVTVKQAKEIAATIEQIYAADLDWGLFDCPIGFCVSLHNNELDQVIESYDIPTLIIEKLNS